MHGKIAAIAAVSAIVIAGCGGTTTTGATKTVTVTAQSPGQIQVSTVTVTAEAATPSTPPGPATTITVDGTYLVGVDIAPGTWRTAGASGSRDCYWKRLASLDSSDIIDNEGSPGPQVTDIMPSDKAFSSSNCLTWQKVG
jgi:hypothetical protein